MNELINLLMARGFSREDAERRARAIPLDAARAILSASGHCETTASDTDLVQIVRDGNLPSHRRALEVQPDTFNEADRSVQIDLASETPARMIDWDRWEYVDEILLMSGLRDDIRRNTLPLLDAHARYSVDNILGSICDIRTESGLLRGRAVISSHRDNLLADVRDGHINALSVGYNVNGAIYIDPGQSAEIDGTTFTAPDDRTLKVCTDWSAHEGSFVPIGADPTAGTRSAAPHATTPNKGERTVNPLIDALIRRGYNLEAATRIAGTLESLEEARALELISSMTPQNDSERAQPAPVAPPATAEPAAPAQPARAAEPSAADAVQAERNRQGQIRQLIASYGDQPGVREICQPALEGDTSIESVREQVLARMAQDQTPVITTGTEDHDHTRANIEAGIALRCRSIDLIRGTEQEVRELRQRGEAFRSFSLVEMARHCLERAGVSTSGLSRLDIVGRAISHSTGDFASILANVAHNSLRAAYATANVQYRRWCGIQSLTDFRSSQLSSLSEAGTLPLVPENGPFELSTLSDLHETIQLATYGKRFTISRQALINDDLNAFTRVPFVHARAAMRTVNQLAVKVLLANAALTQDSVALFHADHSNLDTTTAAVTTKATAEAVIRSLVQKIQLQQDQDGESYLGLQPAFILAPTQIANYFFEATQERGRAQDNAAVDVLRHNLQTIDEPELQNSALTGNSSTDSFMVADPAVAPAVEVGFLDGNEEPRLEQQAGWTVDGTEFKVAHDAAAAAADFRPAAKHEAP